MSKTITFNYKDQQFVLEFTRNSVKKLENKGFDIGKVSSAPLTTITELFSGAFVVHHPMLREEYKEEIYGQLKNKAALIEKLVEMYNETLNSLLDDSDEGNVSWETT